MSSNHGPGRPESRHYVSRGVDVRIVEGEGGGVDLRLDGMPVHVTYTDGEYHSQLAGMFTGFPTVDDLVESLLRTQGKTWVLRGGHTGGGHGGHGGGGHGGGGHGGGGHGGGGHGGGGHGGGGGVR
ncbi:hypothetical protein [Streptomyces sp. NPDC088812]|uniref:hypothetical protein n=1 Tax=Streptomyces sp. NPDC088812 TaxID=3365905 RepID=UPI0038263D43